MKYKLILSTEDYTPHAEVCSLSRKIHSIAHSLFTAFIIIMNIVPKTCVSHYCHIDIIIKMQKELRNICFVTVRILRTYSIANILLDDTAYQNFYSPP
jgi:hypothetical protein